MARFYSLQIKDIVKETSDCTSIAFEVPADLEKIFTFTQGQHLTLRTEIEGEDIRRSYSLCSSPLEKELRVAVKQIEEGKFSTYANQVLKVGDKLEVMPPMGKFYTELRPDQTKNYVAFAAGSGITPIISIIKTTLKTEPNSTFTLFYSNKQVQSIIFKEEIEGLKNKFLQRFQVFHFLTQEQLDIPLFNGRFTGEKLSDIFSKLIQPDEVDECFLCGPEDMTFEIKDFLLEKGIEAKKIHFELFTTAESRNRVPRKVQKTANKGPVSKITVKDGGKSFAFDLPFDTMNILDAAMQKGADLPFACKGGVCCTCKARLIEGEVDMEVNYALEPEEIAAGYILTCQSYPTSEKVVVDYDEAI
ncbi:UNVERIFIED_CONTAM: hypothetical protein GTU68_024006 [Idotea baltica]|nr:hypothetical protein [Idotea baltica]